MKRLILLLTTVVVLGGCSASWHLNKAEKHIGIAIAKGAKIDEKVKTDSIVKDSVVFVEGNSMDDSFGFNNADTVFINKEKIITKVVVDCRNKKGHVAVKCPDKYIRYTVKYYITRTTERKISSGYTVYHLIGFTLLGMLAMFIGLHGYYAIKNRPK